MKKLLFLSVLIASICFFACKSKNYENLPAPLAELCRNIDKNPKNSDLYQQRAEYYYRNNQVDKGLADILQAIKLDNTKSSYYITLANIYFAQSETDLVEEMLQKAIAMDNNNEAYLKLAELFLILKMYNQCDETLEKAIRLQNHNPKAFLTKAILLIETGDTIGYVRMMQLVIDQDPKEILAYQSLAEFFQEKLDPLAISYFKNALEINPNNKMLNFNLGRLYQDLGELELAKEQYQNLIIIDPNSYPAYTNLGSIALVFEDNYEEAVRLFSKALEINPQNDMAWSNRGIAYYYLKEYQKARADFLQCLKVNPDNEAAIKELKRLDDMKK